MRIAIRKSTRGILDSKASAQTSTKEAAAEDVEKPAPPEDPCASACSICQEPVGEPTADGIIETWASLPCGHAFGSGCIKTWLAITEHPSCPICRLSMAHSCRHPVLPVLEPPPNRFAANTALVQATAPKLLTSSAPQPSSWLVSSRSPYHHYLLPRAATTGRATAATTWPEKWHWQGRKLSGQCGFCAALRRKPPLPFRLAAAALKLALSRSRRGRRIVAMQPSMYYGESEEDPWRIAFRTWWSQQDPTIDASQPPAPQLEAAPAEAATAVAAATAAAVIASTAEQDEQVGDDQALSTIGTAVTTNAPTIGIAVSTTATGIAS